MKQFHVPQFIEVEDKIFGPLTLKQFLYVIGGAGTVFILYALLRNLFPFIINVLIVLPFGAFFLALAFYKVNEQPFIKFLENALAHYSGARLFVWKKADTNQKFSADPVQKMIRENTVAIPKTSGSKLKDLAFSIDIEKKNR
jgi:hypothetical protein